MNEDSKDNGGLNLSRSGADVRRIVLPKREPAVVSPIIDAGIPFWDKLSPDKQAILEGPIRKIEESIARQFPEGYVSPLVGKATDLRGQLERQTDLTSCTYIASGNALRVLDQPRIEY